MPLRMLLIFTACCLLRFHSQAQNIDRDAVSFDYILMPLQKLPDTTETYFVTVKNRNTAWGNNLGTTDNEDALKFNGYYKLPSVFDADVITNVEVLTDLQFAQVILRSQTYKRKVDKNTEISYTAYTYDVKYITPKVHLKIAAGNGASIEENTYGGITETTFFGSTDYENCYQSESALERAWGTNKKNTLAEQERTSFGTSMSFIISECNSYCLIPAHASFNVKYVKEKKSNDYDDLLQAKNLLEEAADDYKTDQVAMINKLIQPDYNKRNQLLDSAIDIWTKALDESDMKNRKARIDQKVTRHIYYDLAFAYALKNDFAHAQQYLQGREDEETDKVALKNTLAGMKNLSGFIDQQNKRQAVNKWRTLLYADPAMYVYKDPATRQKEAKEKQLAMQKAKSDSLKALKKNANAGKGGLKKPGTAVVKKTKS